MMLVPFNLSAQGDLLITPRRVVFEGDKQSQELTLANTGNDTARYNVSFLQYRMTENGAFEEISQPDSGQYFADAYLRFFPRSVTLAPNEAQVVRMQFRRRPDMKDAEYRSHVYFRAVPDEKPLGDLPAQDSASIGIRLIPIFGISIPVIVRVGALKVNVDIANANLVAKSDSITELSLTFSRKGDKSVYGDLTVNWQADGGSPIEVGLVRGIAVYTPNESRHFTLQLQNLSGVDYTRGKLIIKYAASSDLEPELFAEKEVLLK
jgi:P pilus assembly chaperone PapD